MTSSREETSPLRISSACRATPANASSSRSMRGAIYSGPGLGSCAVRTARWTSFAVAMLLLGLVPGAHAEPILDPLGVAFPKFQGAPATADELVHTRAPQNPFMAPNP